MSAASPQSKHLDCESNLSSQDASEKGEEGDSSDDEGRKKEKKENKRRKRRKRNPKLLLLDLFILVPMNSCLNQNLIPPHFHNAMRR
jgi:hypothetical protein